MLEQQEPPHRKGATAFTFLICSHSLTRGKISSILPGLRRKKTGLPKSSFKMKVSFFCISFETEFLESEGKVEVFEVQREVSAACDDLACHVIC